MSHSHLIFLNSPALDVFKTKWPLEAYWTRFLSTPAPTERRVDKPTTYVELRKIALTLVPNR